MKSPTKTIENHRLWNYSYSFLLIILGFTLLIIEPTQENPITTQHLLAFLFFNTALVDTGNRRILEEVKKLTQENS